MRFDDRLDFWRLFRERCGNVTVEFGFLIPILVTLAIATVDFGRMGLQKIALTNAARAATQYATQDLSTLQNDTMIRQAAYDDYGADGSVLNISDPYRYTVCPGSSDQYPYDQPPFCGIEYPYTYLEVTVSREFEFLIPYPGIESPVLISSTHKMRFR